MMLAQFPKTIATISFCIVLLMGLSASAQTATDLAMKKYTDVAPGVNFILPAENIAINVPTDGGAANKFFLDGKEIATIKYNTLSAIVTGFQMNITANHTDWLIAYSVALGVKAQGLQLIKNNNGIIFGVGQYVLPKYPEQPVTVAVAFAGDRGYFIQSKTSSSAALVKSAVANMQIPGSAWGMLEPTKEVSLGSKTININESFTATPIDADGIKGVIVTNAGLDEISAIVMTVKTELASDHAENRKVFEAELVSAKLTLRVIRDQPNETVFAAKSEQGREFVTFIATQGTSSVSLIVPDIKTDVNAWLSGKYYYNAALRAMKQ